MRSVKVLLTIGLGCFLAMGCDRYKDYVPEKGIEKDPVKGGGSGCNGSKVAYQTIAQNPGHASNIKKDQNLVIESSQKWESVWASLKGPDATVPSIDFSKNVVFAVFQGEKPTGSYAIEIDLVCKGSNAVDVEVLNKVPEQGCPVTQAFTHPYHLVKVSKSNLITPFNKQQVNFEEQTVKHCSSRGGN